MENKIKLIVLEGHDRTGKDTLLDMLDFNDFLVYKQKSSEEEGVDYKNPKVYEEWMKKNIRKVLNDLYVMNELNGTDRPIVMTRLLLTDNVFADLYNREHIVEKWFKEEIDNNFDCINYIMLWRNYDEYKFRMRKIGKTIDFNKEEFEEITKKFVTYKDKSDLICEIDDDNTKDEIYWNFYNKFKIFTPKCRPSLN